MDYDSTPIPDLYVQARRLPAEAMQRWRHVQRTGIRLMSALPSALDKQQAAHDEYDHGDDQPWHQERVQCVQRDHKIRPSEY